MLDQVKKYTRYRWNAKNEYQLHSPFLFDLYLKVFKKDVKKPSFTVIENLRTQLKNNNTILHITDLGAGSKKNNSNERSIASIARASLKKPKYARLLHRLVNHLQPENIIELGTSLGITTAYLSTATLQTVYSIEGCPEIYQQAKKNLHVLGLTNVKCINENFDSGFQKVLDKVPSPGLIYIDGNHRQHATLNYFYTALPYLDNNSVLVFDDIHWSDEMEAAWNEIIQHKDITASIDLFEMGIVFFRKELSKEHFILRY